MKQTNPMLLIDFYKATHDMQLPKNITKSMSYFTPRMSRVNMWDEVVMFGLQGFTKTYLMDYFNEAFFERTFDEVVEEYKELLEKIPHKTWKDLAIIYKVILDETAGRTATVTITNKHLEMWNIDAEDLHRRAILNKSTISPTKIIPMMQLLNQMMMQEMGISEMEEGELEEMEDYCILDDLY